MLAGRGEPFLLLADFELQKPRLYSLDTLEKNGIVYALNQPSHRSSQARLESFPTAFEEYKNRFDCVIENIKDGNVYLLNLCLETRVKTNLSLETIYENSEALFKIMKKDDFVCFTPERFVSIADGTIGTFPMKGTIAANLPDAEMRLLKDAKELAEHTMIVDLLRNDLGMVARDIKVSDFRYMQLVQTNSGSLYQTSSKIEGTLPHSWREHLGDILFRLLPAGSISGTPKISAVNLIKKLEDFKRGYFTGIAGIFDGRTFDSFVLIRFIEQKEGGLVFKSGGGLTLDSDAKKEYQEILEKIYFSF